MVKVVIPDHLRTLTAGVAETDVAAENVRELLTALEERWPGSAATFARCAIAVDGQIYQDAFLEPLAADSEVFFMQRIEGG